MRERRDGKVRVTKRSVPVAIHPATAFALNSGSGSLFRSAVVSFRFKSVLNNSSLSGFRVLFVQPLDFKRNDSLRILKWEWHPVSASSTSCRCAWRNHPGFASKIPIDHIADHDQVTRNLALSRVLGAELILWWSFFASRRASFCVANPVFHHSNFTLAHRLSHFVCVVFRDSSRAADAALLVFDFDPSEFSSIDFSERECAHVLSGNISKQISQMIGGRP